MKLKTYILFIIGLALSTTMSGQNKSIVDKYLDSLQVAKMQRPIKLGSQSNISPYYFQMFFPGTYYSSVTKNVFSLADSTSQTPINLQLLRMYANKPSVSNHYDTQFENQSTVESKSTVKKVVDEDKDIKKTVETTLTPKEAPTHYSNDMDLQMIVKRPNFWKTSGNFKLQFQQNYFSENWYQGGNNNETFLSNLILSATYNDTKKLTWENKLEMKLGFVTTTSDTCHTFLSNNDKIELTSKLGLKAAKNWSYTISLDAKTQFMPGYRSNNRLKYSDFISPLDVFISTGMDFKPQFKNGNTLSIAILPLSYKLRYIGSDDENIHKVYNFVNRTTQQDYGSRIDLNSSVKIAKNFTWKVRSYCYSSYEYVEAELENKFSYAFTKLLSTELYTLWRFDDNRAKKYYDDNLGYFQFKEYFTFGLSYSF